MKSIPVEAPAAFDELLAPHWEVLVQVAGRLAASGHRDDVVQETLALAWRRWETFDAARGTFRAWLLAIAVDQARRTHRRRWLSFGSHSIEVAAAPVDSALRADVEHALAALPDRQRIAVQLRYYADLTVPEVAAAMRCSEGTVKSTLHDARNALRKRLGEDYR